MNSIPYYLHGAKIFTQALRPQPIPFALQVTNPSRLTYVLNVTFYTEPVFQLGPLDLIPMGRQLVGRDISPGGTITIPLDPNHPEYNTMYVVLIPQKPGYPPCQFGPLTLGTQLSTDQCLYN